MTNADIRFSARMAGVPLWRVAENLRIGEATLYRKLRQPLSESERQGFLRAIAEEASAGTKQLEGKNVFAK